MTRVARHQGCEPVSEFFLRTISIADDTRSKLIRAATDAQLDGA